MVSIASKCRVGLRVAKHHPCVGTECGGGFSSGYVLLSFQNLTPSSCQNRLTTLNWTKATPTKCMQTEENAPYKGGWLEIGPTRWGRMNQNTQTSRLTLRWSILVAILIECCREAVPECQPSTWVVPDIQVWLPVRDGDERSHLLLKALC